MHRAREMLRSGDWLTRERVRLVAIALLIASAAGFLFLVVTSHGAVDLQGRPLGTDFSNVYAAGTYVLGGDANAAFDPPQQFAREQAIFGAATQFYGWHYPPYFLFVAAPLALLPYGLALAVWQGGDARALFVGDVGDCCFVIPGAQRGTRNTYRRTQRTAPQPDLWHRGSGSGPPATRLQNDS